MQFSPPPMRRPIILTDDKVRAILARSGPIILSDGPVPVSGRIIGWQRMDIGTLGAIVVNPLTDKRFLYGVDFGTGAPRSFGPPRLPKVR